MVGTETLTGREERDEEGHERRAETHDTGGSRIAGNSRRKIAVSEKSYLTDWLGLRLGTAKWLLAAEIELFMTLGGVEAVETAFRQRKKINFAFDGDTVVHRVNRLTDWIADDLLGAEEPRPTVH